MKHYPHHIGDFDRATRHLTRIERSVYRDMIELYYDTETMLPLDQAWICRKILAKSNEESTAVEQVLNEFFTKTPNGWYHVRCEEEIEAYKANTSQRAQAGKASAEAKRLRKERALNGNQTVVERSSPTVATELNGASTNQSTNQPINQEEKNTGASAKRGKPASIIQPDGVIDSVWKDFLAMRKAKRAPLTQTALDGIAHEAAKAGMPLTEALALCCARGWQGFKAEWVAGQKPSVSMPQSKAARQAADQAWVDELMERKPANVIDITDAQVVRGSV